MTPAQAKLQHVLGAGYKATVLHQISLDEAFRQFNIAATDPDVMAAAKAEFERSDGISDHRCFVSNANANFLSQAIAQFVPVTVKPVAALAPPVPTVSVTPPPVQTNAKPHHQEDDNMSSKLTALADLAKSTIAQVEADAEAEVNKLLAAKDKANAAVAGVGAIRTGIETGTKELEDFANQLTNGGPPLGG